jgi:outer membrane lipopolysaccharide assembly protein LptE/RlpB
MSLLRIGLHVLLLTAAGVFSGCASYRLGAGGDLPFRSVHVPLVEDSGYAPQARALLTAQVREELNRSGRVEVVSDPSAAEATLRIRLAPVDRETSVTAADDSGRPLKLERTFRASVTLSDASGKALWLDEREIETERFVLILPGSGLANAEFVEMPEVTRSLAGRIAQAVLSTW